MPSQEPGIPVVDIGIQQSQKPPRKEFWFAYITFNIQVQDMILTPRFMGTRYSNLITDVMFVFSYTETLPKKVLVCSM